MGKCTIPIEESIEGAAFLNSIVAIAGVEDAWSILSPTKTDEVEDGGAVLVDPVGGIAKTGESADESIVGAEGVGVGIGAEAENFMAVGCGGKARVVVGFGDFFVTFVPLVVVFKFGRVFKGFDGDGVYAWKAGGE